MGPETRGRWRLGGCLRGWELPGWSGSTGGAQPVQESNRPRPHRHRIVSPQAFLPFVAVPSEPLLAPSLGVAAVLHI